MRVIFRIISLLKILATQERLPCVLVNEVPRLGYLDPSSSTPDLKTGTKLELPLWLARPLSIGRQRMITVELPKIYNDAYGEILKADACAVDLSKLGNFFYDFGAYLAEYDVQGDVGEMLVNTFKFRFRQLMDLSQNTLSDPQASSKLDYLELILYKGGIGTAELMHQWLVKGKCSITAGSLVTSYNKRKSDVLDE